MFFEDADLRLQLGRLGAEFVDLGLDRGLLVAARGLHLAHELADLRAAFLGEAVLLGLEGLSLGGERADVRVELDDAVDVHAHALALGAELEAVGVLTEGFEIDHGAAMVPAPPGVCRAGYSLSSGEISPFWPGWAAQSILCISVDQ